MSEYEAIAATLAFVYGPMVFWAAVLVLVASMFLSVWMAVAALWSLRVAS